MSIRKQTTAINQSAPNIINFICEALSCSNQATEKINVNAGKFGIISFNLCNNCIKLFKEEVKDN